MIGTSCAAVMHVHTICVATEAASRFSPDCFNIPISPYELVPGTFRASIDSIPLLSLLVEWRDGDNV